MCVDVCIIFYDFWTDIYDMLRFSFYGKSSQCHSGRPLLILFATHFYVSFTGGDWISTLNYGSDSSWKLLVIADLSVRRDTGRINSSPKADISPIVRLQRGCNHTIKIPGILYTAFFSGVLRGNT